MTAATRLHMTLTYYAHLTLIQHFSYMPGVCFFVVVFSQYVILSLFGYKKNYKLSIL